MDWKGVWESLRVAFPIGLAALSLFALCAYIYRRQVVDKRRA